MTPGDRALRIGLIGCGRVAQLVHLPVLTTLPGVRLVAVSDPDPQRLAAAGRRVPGVVAVPDTRVLLDLPDVEAVVICAPNEVHAELAVAAMQRRKHLYLEKPLATTLDDGGRVLAALKATGVIGMIGFNFRFNRLYRALKQCLGSGEFGQPVAVRTVLSAPETSLPAWKRTRGRGGGVLLDMASHHFDLLRFVFGDEIREVSARLQSHRSEDDTAVVHVRLRGGLAVQSLFSSNTVNEDRWEVYTERARLSVDRYRGLAVEISGDPMETRAFARTWSRLWSRSTSLRGSGYLLERYRAPGREPSFRAALASFVDAVRQNGPAEPDFRDGYLSLSVVVSAEESARSGRVVLRDPAEDALGVR